MKGTDFSEELQRSWLGAFYWGIGMASLMMFLNAIMQNNAVIEQMRMVLGTLPQGVLKPLGFPASKS